MQEYRKVHPYPKIICSNCHEYKEHQALGLCRYCYNLFSKHTSKRKIGICNRCKEERPILCKGLCDPCYLVYGRPERVCDGCGQLKKYFANGLCKACYHKKWFADNIGKKKAYSKIKNEIFMKRMLPAKECKCHFCSEPANHYHHVSGYEGENALNVIPVCVKCHRNEREEGVTIAQE